LFDLDTKGQSKAIRILPGNPPVPNMRYDDTPFCLAVQSINFWVDNTTFGTESYNWKTSEPLDIDGGSTFITEVASSNDVPFTVDVSASNKCGTSIFDSYTFTSVHFLNPSNTLCDQFTQEIPSGLDDKLDVKDFAIQPNPSTGAVMVKSNKQGILKVYDVTAKKVLEVLIKDGQTTIDLEKNGVYLFIFDTDNGSRITERVIINE